MTALKSHTSMVVRRARSFKLIVLIYRSGVLIALVQLLLTLIATGLSHAKPIELVSRVVVAAGQPFPRTPAPNDTLEALMQRIIALDAIVDSLLGEAEDLRAGLVQMETTFASTVNIVETNLSALGAVRESHNELRREVSGMKRDLTVADSTTELWRNSVSDSLHMAYGQIVSEKTQRNLRERRFSTIAGIAVSLLLIGMCSVWWYGRRRTEFLEASIRRIQPELAQQFRHAVDELFEGMDEQSIKAQEGLIGLMKKMAVSLDTITAAPNHGFPISMCNVANRIERNLNMMDSRVKGHKHLLRCIRDVKKSLQVHGYEMPDLVGMRYETEMENLKPEFIADDSLPPREQTITRIDRPLILYGGRTIQGAWVTVSVGPNQ